MKLLSLLLASSPLYLANGFTIAPKTSVTAPSATKMSMTSSDDSSSRRSFITSSTASAAGIITASAFTLAGTPLPAFALADPNYQPKYDDLRAIYELAVTLDRLAEKCADPDQFEAALSGVRAFNKSPSFYPGYARNFVSKSVKANAEGDPRVGYVKTASSTISGLQGLLEGREGLTGAEASEEAVKRVKRSQQLLAKFLGESGVTDEKVVAFVAAHP